jgi:hypothetical protein
MHLALVLFFFVLWLLRVRWLLQRTHHVLLKGLLLEHQAILVPNKVWRLQVEAVSLHATLELAENESVVGVSSEAQRPAVQHEFLKLYGLVKAKLLDSDLLLLALNVIVFFVLGAAGQSLPWERAS